MVRSTYTPPQWIITAENVIKNSNLSTEVALDLKPAPSNYPYILSHTLSCYDLKHVCVPLAADKCAEIEIRVQRNTTLSVSFVLHM